MNMLIFNFKNNAKTNRGTNKLLYFCTFIWYFDHKNSDKMKMNTKKKMHLLKILCVKKC